MAVVNPVLSPIVYPAAAAAAASANVKDSRWLTLDVCREFTRNKCSRSDDECRFAHPPPNVEVQNGRVMCCFDSIKGKCQRRDPPCKYLHPPQHLKEQLLQNGRNNLILKHLQMQMIAHSIPGVYPIMYDMNTGKSFSASYIPLPGQDPYLTPRYLLPSGPATGYGTYYTTSPACTYATAAGGGGSPTGGVGGAPVPVTTGPVYPSPHGAATCTAAPAAIPYTTVDNGCGGQQTVLLVSSSPMSAAGQQNGLQLDRLENGVGSCQNGVGACGQPASPVWQTAAPSSPSMVAVDSVGSAGATYNSPIYFQTTNGMTGMMPIMKQPSMPGGLGADSTKCGGGAAVSFYQPAAFAYQQMALAAMQIQPPAYVPITIAGHPPMEPRY